jgi:hypothetical protein
MGFTSILTQKPQSSQQEKNGKGQNVWSFSVHKTFETKRKATTNRRLH